MNLACVLTVVGVWIEKGMGMVVPGFVPTPIGEIYEYTPSFPEIAISVGIWGLGLLLFTLLAKAALPDRMRQPAPARSGARRDGVRVDRSGGDSTGITEIE